MGQGERPAAERWGSLDFLVSEGRVNSLGGTGVKQKEEFRNEKRSEVRKRGSGSRENQLHSKTGGESEDCSIVVEKPSTKRRGSTCTEHGRGEIVRSLWEAKGLTSRERTINIKGRELVKLGKAEYCKRSVHRKGKVLHPMNAKTVD